jgi:hypothetical protein
MISPPRLNHRFPSGFVVYPAASRHAVFSPHQNLKPETRTLIADR